MKNKKIYFILLIVSGVFFIGFDRGSSMNDQLSEEDKIFYGFIVREGKKIGEKYDMHHCSTGGGGGEDRIWLMSLSFQKYGPPVAEEEARKLVSWGLRSQTRKT